MCIIIVIMMMLMMMTFMMIVIIIIIIIIIMFIVVVIITIIISIIIIIMAEYTRRVVHAPARRGTARVQCRGPCFVSLATVIVMPLVRYSVVCYGIVYTHAAHIRSMASCHSRGWGSRTP